MKRWALLVAGLYLLILAVLTVPFILLVFSPQVSVSNALEPYSTWQYWLWLLAMAAGQLALLAVPVRVVSRRPLTRRAIWPTLLAGGFMAGGLALAAAYSLVEFFTRGQSLKAPHVWGPPVLGIIAWIAWGVVFARLSRMAQPTDWVTQQCRWLLRGSILELLIAVPTHIVARSRDYCCAGLLTFIGLTMGASVMLFSFGPAVYFLYAERWRRLHGQPPPIAEESPASR